MCCGALQRVAVCCSLYSQPTLLESQLYDLLCCKCVAVHRSALQCVAACTTANTSQGSALWFVVLHVRCTASQRVAVCCSVYSQPTLLESRLYDLLCCKCVAARFIVLRRVTVCIHSQHFSRVSSIVGCAVSVLQCIAARCSVLQCAYSQPTLLDSQLYGLLCCSVLLCIAARRSVLQCVFTPTLLKNHLCTSFL